MDFKHLNETLVPLFVAIALKVVAAIGFWIVGRWLIGAAVRVLARSLRRQKIEETLIQWMVASVDVALNIALIVAILGYFGIETTTFAALIAAAGIAIGAAWAGLLANFAAGVFLVILRPFKVGDVVSVGGMTGTVREIGLFATTIVTADNVATFMGNNKIFGDTIQNFSSNAVRRVDRTAQLASGADTNRVIAYLKERLAAIPNVVQTPAPEVNIVDFSAAGPVLSVRPYTNIKHYWQVYFDTNQLIREAVGGPGDPAHGGTS